MNHYSSVSSAKFFSFLAVALAAGLLPSALRGDAPPAFTYTTPGGVQVGVEIFDKQGQWLKNLEIPEEKKAGTYGVTWDGLDYLGNKMPPGDYECRVILNPALYTTRGPIGNTSLFMGVQNPLTVGHQVPSDIESMAVDPDGYVYTADSWDEAGQDFRKWDRETGQWVFDGQYEIRNGTPNALPYAIALDDKFIYCATFSHTTHAQSHIRRFNLADAKPAPFPGGSNIGDGHILVHDDPVKETPKGTSPDDAALMKQPLRALAVTGGKLYAADYLSNKVWSFDKTSGAPLGSVDVKAPQAIAVDAAGHLWVGHENGKIGVFSEDGRQLVDVVKDLGNVIALAFGPDNLLYAADSTAGKIFIYKADAASQTATLQRTFGQPAVPGDYAPDRFYKLRGLAVDGKGYLTVAQNLMVVGCRVTRFAPDGKVAWDQVGGEFCSSGNYSQARPDDIISQYFHHYKVDRKTGKFEFRGCVAATDPKYLNEQHSPMRLLKLNGQEFAFMGYGTGEEVYRKVGETYHLCSMFSAGSPNPDGIFIDAIPAGVDRPPIGFWSWQDKNGNGKVDPDEVVWKIKPGDPVSFSNMGVNVDNHGNAIFCSGEGDVTEVPMTGFDQRGNPIYDLSKMRVLVPHDTSAKPILSGARMAVRADDGSIYVDSQSQVYTAPPEAGGGWMTGWMLSRYDKTGKRLWYTRMPETCPGMDFVPGGGGVMCITIKYGDRGTPIYHYDPQGMLIGIAYSSAAVLGFSAIPDNTGSLSISRDPRDGIVDMFAEDCVGNRFRWLRMDDHRKPHIKSTWLRLKEAGQPLEIVSAPGR